MAGLEDPEYLPFHKRPEFRLFATDTFQAISSRASQEWVSVTGQLYQTGQVGGSLRAARVPAISPEARLLAFCT